MYGPTFRALALRQRARALPTSYPGSLLGAPPLAGGKTLVQADDIIC